MKLALIRPAGYKMVFPSLGLGYIASYLKEYSEFNDIRIIDENVENVQEELRKYRPDVAGITAFTESYGRAISMAERIKEDYAIPVIVGGVHITTLPTSLSKTFDIGVLGEGEQVMLELLQVYEEGDGFPADKLRRIDGLAFHDNGKVVLTRPRKAIDPLDKVPYPARNLFKMEEFYLKTLPIFNHVMGKGVNMITSRGCPYRCVFCSTSKFWQKYRFHSPKYVVDEIRELVDKYKQIEFIYIMDDLFIANRRRVEEIVKLLVEEGLNEEVKFGINGRANLMDNEMCGLLKKMGVVQISFGFETGSERMLKYLKRGTVTVEDNKNAIKACKKHGLRVDGSFIFGSPHETAEDMRKTIRFIRENDLDSCYVFVSTPYPATEWWDIAERKGIVSKDMDWSKLSSIDTSTLLSDEIEKSEFDKIYEEAVEAMKECSYRNYYTDPSNIISNIEIVISNPLKAARLLLRIFFYKIKKLKSYKSRT